MTFYLFSTPTSTSDRSGYVLFYVIGLMTLLGFFATTSLSSMSREARAARNYVSETQALYHAESGARLVKAEVESRLASGMDLETALTGLSVSPPTGYQFDTISTFEVLVPEKLFRFVSLGREGEAEAELEVQYRVGDPLLESGMFGGLDLSSQPNVAVYGYDSRAVPNPVPGDSNGRATIGSNLNIDLGNNFSLDGTIRQGADTDGNAATLSNPTGQAVEQTGYVDPDPMGANGGALNDTFTSVMASNDNGSVPQISSNTLAASPGDTITFTAGDYYFTDFYTPPNVTVVIDDTSGPVRFYVDGEVVFQPKTVTQGSDAYNFQIYSMSNQDLTIQPNGHFAGLLYAPNAEVNLKPGGNFYGVLWAEEIQLQPNTEIYIDTSLQNRIPSNELSVHAWVEHR